MPESAHWNAPSGLFVYFVGLRVAAPVGSVAGGENSKRERCEKKAYRSG